jgi:hypothetical protein
LYSARFTNISDGTGESAVAKITLSSLIGPQNIAPTAVKIREILYNIQGFSSVRILFDHTTDDVAAVLPAGTGYMDFTGLNGLMDPRSAGATGNILFTTVGASATATYDITLVVELKT